MTAASGCSPSPTRSTPATSSPPSPSTTAPWPPRAPPSGAATCGTAAAATGSQGLASFTVTGPHLAWADALATAGFALGGDGVEWVSRFDGYHALAVTLEGALVADPVLAAHAAA